MRDLLAATHLRLGRGGPFLGLLRRLRLRRDGSEEITRAILMTLAAVWGPFVLLEIASKEPILCPPESTTSQVRHSRRSAAWIIASPPAPAGDVCRSGLASMTCAFPLCANCHK